MQKRAVRTIQKLGPRLSLRNKFTEINVLTLALQYIYDNSNNKLKIKSKPTTKYEDFPRFQWDSLIRV